MILNCSDYNPLEFLFKYDLSAKSVDVCNVVQHELYKAGIVPETGDEFNTVLNLLIELEKKFYGKK